MWAICLNTFREAIRNKILYSVLLFMALLMGASAFFGSVTIGSMVAVIKDCGLFSLSFFGAVITIVTGVNLLNKELKQKTIYNILSKPVSRWEFLLGKYFGLTLTVSLLVSVMGVGLVLFSAIFEGRIDFLLFQGIFVSLLEVSVISAIVLLFSSMAVTTTLPGILTLAAYIAGHSIRYLNFFISGDGSQNTGARYLSLFFSWVLPDLSVFNANELLVYGQSLSAGQAGLALLYCLGYCTATLVITGLIFARRELQ
jgi:ABC-type transport system involved in multi-copper enzyme maturation permease subunit